MNTERLGKFWLPSDQKLVWAFHRGFTVSEIKKGTGHCESQEFFKGQAECWNLSGIPGKNLVHKAICTAETRSPSIK